jgi:hypothetical protein
MDEITLLTRSISNTMILVERLPELKNMEGEGNRLTNALEELKQEIEFLSSRDASEVMSEVTSGEHKPWTYASKQGLRRYRRPTRPSNVALRPIETVLDSVDNSAEMLRQDILEFNKSILRAIFCGIRHETNRRLASLISDKRLFLSIDLSPEVNSAVYTKLTYTD